MLFSGRSTVIRHGDMQRRNRITQNLTDDEQAELVKPAGAECAATFARSIALRSLARRP